MFLPVGVKQNPAEEEVKEWLFDTSCKAHHHKFLISGVGKDDLQNSTMEEIVEFMRLIHESDLRDGTIAALVNNNERSRNDNRTCDGRSKPYRKKAPYFKGHSTNK